MGNFEPAPIVCTRPLSATPWSQERLLIKWLNTDELGPNLWFWTQSYRWLATLRGQPSFIGSKGSAATSLSRSSLFGSEGQTSCTHYPHPGFFRGEKISITLWREKWHCALPRSSWLKVLAIDVYLVYLLPAPHWRSIWMWHRAVCVCCFQSSNQHVMLGFISSTHSSSICPFVQGPNPRVQVVDSGREPPNCKRHSEGHQSCFCNPWWSIVAVPSSECLWAFSLQEVLQTDSSSTSLRVAVHRAKGIESCPVLITRCSEKGMRAIPVGRFLWYEIEANHVQELLAESPHSADPLAGTGSPLLVGVGPERLRLE